MPMNWTPENDRLLLLKILETHNISVNAESIAQAWPSNAPTRPTGRAIKERLVKFREMAGLKVAVKVAAKGSTPKSTLSTPRKSAPAVRAPKTPASSGKKRKRIDNESDADDHVTDDETPIKVKKELSDASLIRNNVQSAMSGLRASMDDPFKQELSQPIEDGSNTVAGGRQNSRARSARQASHQASDELRRRASEDTDSGDDSQVSAFEQNDLEI